MIKPKVDKMSVYTTAEEMIGRLDALLNEQLNQIIHHPSFQRLESAWRGLLLLVNSINKTQFVKVRYLHLPLKTLSKELAAAVEFDQSLIFKKIYTEELDQPGGEPFGLLLGDYYFSHQAEGGAQDPMDCLQQMSKVSAAAFVPFITSVSASFFGLEDFAGLQSTVNLKLLLQSKEYHRWHKLRQSDYAHFLGLTLPRILMRKPYNHHGVRLTQRSFTEKVTNHEDYLWGNACYAYAAVVARCFQESGWFMGIRGVAANDNKPGLLDLNRDLFDADVTGMMPKMVTECLVTDQQEKQFSDAGFIALRDHQMAERSVFYSSQSVKLPKPTRDQLDMTTAKINTMLHYVLCASRFAHYVKVIIRDKIGAFTNAEACEHYVTQWLSKYCSAARGQSQDVMARSPLSAADVVVKEIAGSPGKFYCAMSISPHSQLDDIQSQLKLVTHVRLQ